MSRYWKAAWTGYAVLIVLVIILMAVSIFQLVASSDCRKRGGVPVREMWGKIACAKPMETM